MNSKKQEQDGEEVPIMIYDSLNLNNSKFLDTDKKIIISRGKMTLAIIFLISLFLLFYYIYYSNNKKLIQTIEQLQNKIEILESKIEYLNDTTIQNKIEILESKIKYLNETSIKKKIGIGIITDALYGNGIGRVLSVLSYLLSKTEKYDVYLILSKDSPNDFPNYKGMKKVVLKKDKKAIEEFDQSKDIQIYILNNDVSDTIENYKSLGKKVIGIFHGVFLSCIFTNHTTVYDSWYRFAKFDSFVQIIADDYWIYKKFNFTNVIYIPNLYTFEHTLTPSSPLTNKNVLIVGRIDDVIKGAEFGIKAMAEAIKQVPDAQLYIVSGYHPQNIKNLVKELKIENNVHYQYFTHNISEYYLNCSVLIVSSVSESFPMVMNEGKAHGLPIVAFNIDYSPSFQKGVITVDLFDYKAMGNEIAKLLNDYDYRKKKGLEAKLSLDIYKNSETINTWGELFSSLIKGGDEYKKLQEKIEKKYYNETIARERIERHYKYALQFNKHFRCHSFEQFTNLNYLNNIKDCKDTRM